MATRLMDLFRSRNTQRPMRRRRRHRVAEGSQALEDRTLLATFTWDGGGDGENWYDALNWDGDAVPAKDDDVVIGEVFAGDTIVVDSPTNRPTQPNAIDSAAILRVPNPDFLQISASSTIGGLIIETNWGFSAHGAEPVDQVDITGDFVWSGGNNISNITNLDIHGNFIIEGALGKHLNFGTVQVYGDGSSWSGAGVGGPGQLINHGTFRAATNAEFGRSGFRLPDGLFVNEPDATLIIDAPATEGEETLVKALDNRGTVDIVSGHLNIDDVRANDAAAIYTVAEDAVLEVAGRNITINASTTIDMDGELYLRGGVDIQSEVVANPDTSSLRLTGGTWRADVTVSRLQVDGFGGDGRDATIVVNDHMEWIGGKIRGNGSGLTIINKGTLDIGNTLSQPPTRADLDRATLINEGTATWHDHFLLLSQGADFINRGTLEMLADDAFQGVSGNPTLHNESTGEIIIDPGNNSMGLMTLGLVNAPNLRNDGLIHVRSGDVEILTVFAGITRGVFSQGDEGRFVVDSDATVTLREFSGGTLTGAGTITADLEQTGGTIDPSGQLVIDGDYTQTGGTLAAEISGPNLGTDFDNLRVTGDVSLAGDLDVSLAGGFAPEQGQRFPVLTADGTISGAFANENSGDLGLGFQQDDDEVVLLGQSFQPELTFDFGSSALVEVGELVLRDNRQANGAVADLNNVRVTLLPDDENGPLATVVLNRVTGLDRDGNTANVEGFLIDETVALGNLRFESANGTVLELRDVAVEFDEFSGNLDTTFSGAIRLSSATPEITLPTIANKMPATFEISDDASTPEPALQGALDFANGVFAMTAEGVAGRIGDGFTVRGQQATVVIGNVSAPLLTAAELMLGVNLPGRPGVEVTASELEVSRDGDVSIASVAFEPAEPITEQTVAGVLPFQVTTLTMDPISGDRVSLRDFDVDVKIEGYFDDSKFENMPFTPRIRFGGVDQPTGDDPANRIELTYRLIDGLIQPWDIGPISLGIDGVITDGLTFDGEINLGGYQVGAWNPNLSGFFEVVDTDVSDAALVPFEGIRFDILPEGSTLSVGNDLFTDGGALRVMGEVTVSDEFQGKIGGIGVAGLTIGMQFRIDAVATAESQFVAFSTEASLGELSVQQIVIDVDRLARLTSTAILFDFDPGPNEPIGRIGKIDIQPLDNVVLSGLSQSRVEVFDALVYEDRMELPRVHAVMHGLITGKDIDDDPLNLMLVDDLQINFENASIAADFSQFANDRGFEPEVPFATWSAENVSVNLDSGILAPNRVNVDSVPDVECLIGRPTTELPDVDGLASVACLSGTFDGATGNFGLNAAQMSGRLFDNFRFNASDATLVLGPTAPEPMFQVGEATLTLPLQDQPALRLSVSDLQVSQDGTVSFASARAEADLNPLSNIRVQRFLPVAVDLVEIVPSSGDRVYLNGDDPFDIRVQGEFNTTPFDDFGLTASARIGDGPENTFDANFRLTRLDNGVFTVQLWETGPIKLSLATADADSTLEFDGEITLGGYTDGEWIEDLTGAIDANASVTNDGGQKEAGLTLELLSGSSLTDGNLRLNTLIQFDAGKQGQYLGFDLDGLTASFTISLDWGYTNQAPGIFFTDLTVTPGRLEIAELNLDIANFVTLTATSFTLDPTSEPFASVISMTADFSNNELLNDLGVAKVEATDVQVYSDHVLLGSVTITVDGRFHDLVELDDFEISFTGVRIDGLFSPTNLDQTIEINGSLDGVDFSAESITLLPDSDVTAAAYDISGDINTANGIITLGADYIEGQIYDVFEFASDPVTMVVGPNVDETIPFLEVDGTTSLGMTLLDEKTVTLFTEDFEIARDGTLSVKSAGVSAAAGIARSLGLAEGLLPFDVTLVEIGGARGQRLALNDPTLDIAVTVEGFFDFGLFGDLPFTPCADTG